jgi:hypothetical protein
MVPVFALLLAAACSGDSFEEIQGDLDRLVAAPTQLFLEVGESKTVDVSGVDAQGNPLTFTYEVTNEGAGIDVRRDSTFLPVYVDDSTLQVPAAAERFRFVVTGTDYMVTSFTVSAGGQDIVVPVQVVPQTTLEAGISNQTPGLGEVVTITAPPGTRFAATSVVTQPDPTGAQPFVVSVAADGSSLDVLLPPNLIDAQLTISDVTTDAAPSVVFAPSTALTVTTTAVPSYTGTFSNLTPAVNEAVTLTLGAGQTFDPATTLIHGPGAPTVTDLTATTVTFIPAPGVTGLLVANGVILPELPQIPLSLTAPDTDTISVSPDIPTTPGTTDPSTAPSLVTPGLDRSSVLFDKPPFDNGVSITDVWYKLVVTQAGVYTVTLNWDIGSDIDMFLCPDPGAITGACDFQAATGDHPEIGVFALDPGTYFVIADDFGFDAAGTTVQINVDHAAPAPPAVKAAQARATSVRKARR